MGKKPRILLIGAGRFGINHLRVLKALDKEGLIELTGVVTLTTKKHPTIKQLGIPAYTKLTAQRLKNIDAVDIASPATTHYKIANMCLDHAHVMCEKPLALSVQHIISLEKKAKRKRKILMVGHIFRYNTALAKLKDIIKKNKKSLYSVEGTFIGGALIKDTGALETFMHMFDIMNGLLQRKPKSTYCITERKLKIKGEDFARVFLDYGVPVTLSLGWIGDQKERSIVLRFKNFVVACDLVSQIIVIDDGKSKKISKHFNTEPLRVELEHFISLVKGKRSKYPAAKDALVVQRIIEASLKSARQKKVMKI